MGNYETQPVEFDHEAFFSALDAHRDARKMTWKEVAAETGVSASTLTRMSQGKRPDVGGFAALLHWSGLESEDFTRGSGRKEAAPIARIMAIVRGDDELDPRGKAVLEQMIRSAYDQFRLN